jgi:membrane fusion protein, multidrug efflux system
MKTSQPHQATITPTSARSTTEVILASALLLTGCGPSNRYEPPPAPAVTVSTPTQALVTDYMETTGVTVASRTVELVARIPGYLRQNDFQDGSFVKAGQLLFLIEPEQYQARLQQSQAQLTNAKSEFDRQNRLIQQNATSKSNVEKYLAQMEEAAADTTLSKINLGYTRVTAPFSGRIGTHLVDVGNLVGAASATSLARLDQLDPIWVNASVNERDVLRIRTAQREHRIPAAQMGVTPVELGTQDQAGYPFHGVIDFIATGIDPSIGAIQIRASFKNPDGRLLPGLFARLRIPLGRPEPGLLVPDRAVAADLGGSYVLIVGTQGLVEQRRVKTGALMPGSEGNLRQIIAGVGANDKVIVEGLQNAIPGSKVMVSVRPSPAAAAP